MADVCDHVYCTARNLSCQQFNSLTLDNRDTQQQDVAAYSPLKMWCLWTCLTHFMEEVIYSAQAVFFSHVCDKKCDKQKRRTGLCLTASK